jgi:hypothetical protein
MDLWAFEFSMKLRSLGAYRDPEEKPPAGMLALRKT